MSATNQVIAPTIEPGTNVKGPASYFPAIEATYGHLSTGDVNSQK